MIHDWHDDKREQYYILLVCKKESNSLSHHPLSEAHVLQKSTEMWILWS